MDDALYEALKEKNNWKELTEKLAAFAAPIVRARARLMRSAEAQGMTTEDIVADAIQRALFNRTWNQESYPDVYDYMKSVVESVISDRFRSADRKRTTYASEENTAASDEPTPEEIAGKMMLLEQVEKVLLSKKEKDPLLQVVWDCIKEGFRKNEEFTVLTGTSEEEVEKARRRLRKLLNKVLSEVQR